MLSIHDVYRRILQPAPFVAGPAAPAGALPPLTFTVDSAHQGEEAHGLVLQALAEGLPYALVLVDMRMPPGWDGRETARQLWLADPRLQIIICTACTDYSWAALADGLNHSEDFFIVEKPFDPIELRQITHAFARKWLLARQLEAHTAELEEVVRTRTMAVKRAEEGFEQVFSASPLAQSIIALDSFEVIAVNSAYQKILGFTVNDLSGTTPESFGRGLDASRWRGLLGKLAAKEPIDDHPFVYQPAPGVRRDMRCTARALTVNGRPCSIWVMRDVTDQLRLEEQLRQSQKMDAIGQLAAGVAHDFNNVLTVIQSCTEEALHETSLQTIRELLEPVLGSAKRAATLTRQLLVFSHKQAVEVRPIEITSLVCDLKPVLRRLLPEHIELLWDLPDSVPSVLADAANIEQLIVNLTINARDALPAKGGCIRIGVGLREFATAEETRHMDGRAGRFVVVQVADNGSGIPPEVLPRIFEPFFTTKEVGKGTGLGLSTVYSIARQHNGWIEVQTSVGGGTTFTIFQPAVEEAAGAASADGLHALGAAFGSNGLKRVLAVDDDPSVQTALRLLFDRNGIDAVIEPDGASALKTWREFPGQFDLLITDMVMPNGCTGIELARALRDQEPELKVVLMTGYSADLFNADNLVMPGKPPYLLFKPFELVDFLKAIAAA